MCVANAARSQMAEGLAKELLKNMAHVESAGSQPKSVHPLAIRVLAEVNIDVTRHASKSCDDLDPEFSKKLDYIITLCAEEVCPTGLFSDAKRLHWPMPDPAVDQGSEQKNVEYFRTVRDRINSKLQLFAEQIRITKA